MRSIEILLYPGIKRVHQDEKSQVESVALHFSIHGHEGLEMVECPGFDWWDFWIHRQRSTDSQIFYLFKPYERAWVFQAWLLIPSMYFLLASCSIVKLNSLLVGSPRLCTTFEQPLHSPLSFMIFSAISWLSSSFWIKDSSMTPSSPSASGPYKKCWSVSILKLRNGTKTAILLSSKTNQKFRWFGERSKFECHHIIHSTLNLMNRSEQVFHPNSR